MADDNQPIVIRKVVRPAAHHGGGWKVAFADFATAMMAFFLLLWVLGATNEEQKGAISDYFQNPSRVPGTTDVPAPGPAHGDGGSSPSLIDFKAAAPAKRKAEEVQPDLPKAKPDIDEAERLARERERERLEELLRELQAKLEQNKALEPFRDQLLLDITEEGLRIRILDKKNRAMFALGSDRLKPYTRTILGEIASSINAVDNRISISGHTDARQYTQLHDYTNWELSADRANAARRALITGGLRSDKVGRVVGLGDSVPFKPKDPYAAINRRISIVVMNQRTDRSLRPRAEQATPAAPTEQQSITVLEPEPRPPSSGS
jgi:chemotaxis protein MotB